MPDDNVISIDFRNAKPSITVSEGRDRYCRHGAVQLEKQTRLVTCKWCGAALDPFDVLMGEARRQTNHWHNGNHLAREETRLREQLEDVKRKLRNAKAALKRAKGK